MKKILLVAGARPNFMKIAPLYHELKKYKRFKPIIVHTGQHYDKEMSDFFFHDLELPEPDIYLGVGSGSHSEQTAKTMTGFEKVLIEENADAVVVVGDVNSTIACALTSAKYRCTKSLRSHRTNLPLIVHVEAGLRSFDRSMPEEINRLLTDQIADILFTTCQDANVNILKEGINKNKIFFVGNVMIDSLKNVKKKITDKIIKELKLEKRKYAVLTLHRPSNVDVKKILTGILQALNRISREVPIIFPCHPRTQKQIRSLSTYKNYNLKGIKDIGKNKNGIFLIPPLGYLDFMSLMANAALMLTDSGGIQEETTIFGVPCLTIRENTERPVTVTQGTNRLVGTNPKRIVREALKILSSCKQKGNNRRIRRPKYWDGRTAGRIVHILLKKLSD